MSVEFKRDLSCFRILILENLVEKVRENPFIYPIDQIILIYKLSKYKGIIIHSAGISALGGSYLFCGRSGAGKSTFSSLLSRQKTSHILSDDRIIVREKGGVFHAYGTPWPGEAGIAKNESAPLKGIFFLHKANRCYIKDIGKKEALRQLLPVASIPWYDPETADRVLDTAEILIEEIPAFELHFRPDETVIPVIEETIKKLSKG